MLSHEEIAGIGQQLVSGASWADIDAIHRTFAWLRENSPVHRAETERFPTYHHVTRHADIAEAEQKREVFLNEPRLTIQTLAREAVVKQATGGATYAVKSLVTMDGKEHRDYRALTNAWFQPRSLKALDEAIDSLAGRSVDKLLSRDGSVDIVGEIAVWYPLQVIMTILGIPDEDLPLMLQLTQELFNPEDPDLKRGEGDNLQTVQEFMAYFNAVTEDRRANPRDDVATLIATAEIDGAPIGPREAIGYYIILATAGHDTTSFTVTEAVRQAALNPELLDLIRDDPSVAVAAAEEALRLAAPVRHFIRTAAEDYVLNGVPIAKGENIVLWFPSGSRDERVFDEPDRFRLDRENANRHTSFGTGIHVCLGLHLARKEIVAFLQHLAARVARVELTGTPVYSQSAFVSGIKHMPVAVTAR